MLIQEKRNMRALQAHACFSAEEREFQVLCKQHVSVSSLNWIIWFSYICKYLFHDNCGKQT